MSWPEVSIEDLPPERDDEPASLRQDILDELTDHFACALNRELLKNQNEQLARQRVLNQFGDPIKIARQLWFDAMKEKMMSQKIMTGVSVVMAVCCIAVVGIAWSLMKQSQSVNQKMLAQLTLFAERPQVVQGSSISEEMNQVSFQLVQKKKSGKPAVGFIGKLSKSGNQTDTFTVEAVSNQTGKLEFGKLPWGKYSIKVSAPWGESFRQADVTVIPGRNYSQTIVCPAAPPEEVPVQFQVNWTDKLKAEDWYLLCDFRIFMNGVNQLESTRSFQKDHWLNLQNPLKNSGVYLINKNNQVSLCPTGRDGKYEDFKLDALVENASIRMLQGEYTLPAMYMIQKDDRLKQLLTYISEQQPENSQSFMNILNYERNSLINYTTLISGLRLRGGRLRSESTIHDRTMFLFPFDKKISTPGSKDSMGLNSIPNRANGIQLPHRLNFSALKGQDNVWEINLPKIDNLEIPEGVGTGIFYNKSL